jgi:hypothetical protein
MRTRTIAERRSSPEKIVLPMSHAWVPSGTYKMAVGQSSAEHAEISLERPRQSFATERDFPPGPGRTISRRLVAASSVRSPWRAKPGGRFGLLLNGLL